MTSYEEAEVRLIYRENKEQDITTALGRTKVGGWHLRKRKRIARRHHTMRFNISLAK